MAVLPERTIRRGDVLWRATLRGVLVRSVGGEEIVLLAGTGAALWDELEEPAPFGDLCAALAARFSATDAQVAADLEPVVTDLVERGVLHRV